MEESPAPKKKNSRLHSELDRELLIDETLRSINTLIGANISFQEIIVSIIQRNVTSEYGLLKEIHALNKRLMLATERFVAHIDNIKELKEADVGNSIFQRLYCRLIEKLTRKFIVYEHHKKKLSFMTSNIKRLYRIYEDSQLQGIQTNLVALLEALRVIITQNSQLYQLLLDMLVSENFVSSIDEFNLVGTEQIQSNQNGRSAAEQAANQERCFKQRKNKRQGTHRLGKAPNKMTIEELFKKLKEYNDCVGKTNQKAVVTLQDNKTVLLRQTSRVFNDVEKIVTQSRQSNFNSHNNNNLINFNHTKQQHQTYGKNTIKNQEENMRSNQSSKVIKKPLPLETVDQFQNLAPLNEHYEKSIVSKKIRQKIKSYIYQKTQKNQLKKQMQPKCQTNPKSALKKPMTQQNFHKKVILNFQDTNVPDLKFSSNGFDKGLRGRNININRNYRMSAVEQFYNALKQNGYQHIRNSFILEAVDQLDEQLPDKVQGVLRVKKFRSHQSHQSDGFEKIYGFPKLPQQSEFAKKYKTPKHQYYKSVDCLQSRGETQREHTKGIQIIDSRQDRISTGKLKFADSNPKYDIFCPRDRRIFPKYIL